MRTEMDEKKVAKELEVVKTEFCREVDTRVLQGIVLQVLAKIEGIAFIEGTLFDSLLGRDLERIKGIHVEQQKGKGVVIKVEINIVYGISIPKKSEEIQNRLMQEVALWTGLEIASIHIIFKELIAPISEAEEESVDEEDFEPAL